MLSRPLLGAAVILVVVSPAFCQQDRSQEDRDRVEPAPKESENGPPQPEKERIGVPTSKRIFWIIPNYRTSPSLKGYRPISVRQKFKIAEQDSFDRGTIVLAAAFAGEGQISRATPEFGQGVAGYARYFATSYADLAIADFLTEAIYPAVLHQDPRYFRRGTGSGLSRLGYAVHQIFWTRRVGGGSQFNFSEIAGNASAVAISAAYYPGIRDTSSAASQLGMQIGVDLITNVLKEFWPDLNRKFARKHHIATPDQH